MDIFSEESKQQVLKTLFDLATDKSVPAIKLYLDLINEQTPSESLSVEKALEIIRSPEHGSPDPAGM